MNEQQKKEILNRALSAFLGELSGQLDEARQAVDEFVTQSNFSKVDGELIRYHSLKGGAGFLGLDELARVAAQLEVALSAVGAKEGCDTTTLMETFKEFEYVVLPLVSDHKSTTDEGV